MLSVPDQWVWDFWLADDGAQHHCFFLHAPKSVGDENRRHRAARIGHAVSANLADWTMLPTPFSVGEPGSFDETATWTGSVVRGEDGLWRMFYTGSSFLDPEPGHRNVETVGVAVSADLLTWEKLPGPVTRADARWYETLGTSDWKEEAWRDPWVFRDPQGKGWHMLVTARANVGDVDSRGVIGHAWSADLDQWEVLPPLSAPDSGFGHLEVPQVARVDDQWVLLFSCPDEALSATHPLRGTNPGTWSLPISSPTQFFDVEAATPLTSAQDYSGRLTQSRDSQWVLMTFDNGETGAPFPGVIENPGPISAARLGSPERLRHHELPRSLRGRPSGAPRAQSIHQSSKVG